MHQAEVYARTAKGTLEMRNRASALPQELQPVLKSIDGRASVAELGAQLELPGRAVQQALQQLASGGYIQPAQSAPDIEDDDDLDFASPGAMSRLQAQAEARARAESAARARAEEARREAAAAQRREDVQAQAQADAQAQASLASVAREQAQSEARAADEERTRARQQASEARSAEAKSAAQARMEAALLAEAQAAARTRELEAAESAARAALARTQDTAARARIEAQAHARAESEAQARAHAEAHARAMVEAQLKAMGDALARAQALARDEADARARLTADLQAREAAEVQARADAAARARAEASTEMRAELERLREEAQQALAEADARAEGERQARAAAEALAEEERSAREAAQTEASARLEAQRRAHAAARAATQVQVEEERAAREAAESRAQAERDARRAHEAALQASADERVRAGVADEIRAREEAERAADAEYRAAAARRAERAAAAQTPPAPRAALPRKPIDKTMLASVGAVSALTLAIAGALLLPSIPLDGYLPRAERAAADLLQQPVRIGRMEYHLLPAPELVLERVAVGAAHNSHVERITVSAWPWELTGAQLRLDAVTLQGAVIARHETTSLAGLLAPRNSAIHVDRLLFDGATIAIQDLEFPVSSAAVRFERSGRIGSIRVASGGATLDAAPLLGSTWQLTLHARNWRPPLGPALAFESLAVKGVVTAGRFTTANLEARVAGGEVTGNIVADWRNGVRADGRFQVTEASLQSLLSAYTSHFSARGTLAAQGQYALQGASLGRLLDAPRVAARFEIGSGELVNVDVVQALQQVSAKGVQGGRTRFDRLSGTVEIAGDRYRYRQLKLASGPMTAAGDVEVAPGNRLAGRVTAEVNLASRTAIRGLLTVSGTLANPVLRP